MKRMATGIKPTGKLTLGNYLGAIKPFIKYQDEYELFVFIADLHALTVYQDPAELRRNSADLLKTYLAAGLDPKRCKIFNQSDVPAHNQLEWILTCSSFVPDLLKMPQYKNYVERHDSKATPAGMLMYPSLMNADILLYDADCVPVGIDQKPHVDFAHDVANWFNKRYGETFKVPEAIVPKVGAKIMSLTDPTKKMSKSESDKGTIYLNDDDETIRKKILKAKADMESKIYYDPINKPGISNLLTIYAAIEEMSVQEAEAIFKDEADYKVFKLKVADAVIDELSRLKAKKESIKFDEEAFKSNYEYVSSIANKKIQEVYERVGLR